MSVIEEEIPERNLVHLFTIKHGQLAIVEATVEGGAEVLGLPLSQVNFPPNTVISVVLRDGTMTIPRGDTILQPKDEIIAIVKKESEDALRQMLGAA